MLYGDSLHFLNHYQGFLTSVDAKSGVESHRALRLPGAPSVYASLVGAANRIYVVDLSNELAYRFSNMIGADHVEYDGSAGTHFDRPESIDVDANGRIYVVDLGTHLMVAFDDMSGAGQVETVTVASPVSIYAEDN